MDPLLASIEARTKGLNLSVTRLCELAGMSHTTFIRAARGESSPTLETVRRLEATLDKLEKQQRRQEKKGKAA
jgi:transcriptional regulator with XRE-family HTH domain